ncbi:PREDICTED: uncharacterized protein LOC108376370, partial [Rhagoletis zephyria]|uniref:uncharacterized protein LOC108376370 n=1 Tax=Rhagoletis zephyria TaxID=28612 RepID=UPI0008113B0F
MDIEQRKHILKREGRCYRFAKPNHSSKFCKNQWLKCNNCNGRHITPLCEAKTKRYETAIPPLGEHQTSSSSVAVVNSTSTTLHSVARPESNDIYLQTAKAILSSETKRVLSRIIMDNGSQGTYVSESLANYLKLTTVGYDQARIFAFGENNQRKQLTRLRRVNVKVQSQYSDQMIEICASVVPIICADVLPEPRFEDNYWKFHLDTNDNIGENLVAVDTFFGWTIQGCCGYNENSKCALSIIENREEQVDVTKFWDLEAIGIAVYNENASAVHDVQIEKIVMRYSVSLPWKIPKETLHNNKSNALNRLRGLTIKLMKNREKLIEYDCGIRELLNAGIAERVLANHNDQIAYYMPHRPVYREDKTTTKMRIVFDASSSENDLASLNDHLSPGENLLADLMSILLRFRCYHIAIIADIEKAFLQISIDEADRDTHRFFWYETLSESFSKLPPVVEL